jgi:hypothetical protein
MLPVIERLAAPWMVRPESPSADLYFLNACGGWVGPGRPVARLGPGVFASAGTLLVMRHAGRAGALPRRPRTIWLIDDDVAAALADPGLPRGQRLKLALFEHRHGARLLARGAEVVASSEALAERFAARAPTHLLHPHWYEPLADLAHHAKEEPLRIAFLGSAVHAGDLAFIEQPLLSVLERVPRAELHMAANHAPGRLAGHPRLVPMPGTSWPEWRAALPLRRFHVALYPLLDTPVNRARSVNKLIEHAIVGAAGVYSAAWPESARVRRRGAGLVLGPEPEAWEAAVLRLLADRALRRRIAAAGRALAADLNHAERQRGFWRHALSLDDTALLA